MAHVTMKWHVLLRDRGAEHCRDVLDEGVEALRCTVASFDLYMCVFYRLTVDQPDGAIRHDDELHQQYCTDVRQHYEGRR